MAVQFSTAVRNGMLNAWEAAIGQDAVMKIRTGAPPANVAAADSGNILATINLPTDWMADAANGAKAKSGTWEDTAADLGGTPGHYRIYAADGTTCHEQGTVTAQGGGGDLELTATFPLVQGQPVGIASFTKTMGGA
jgi:hypothetical protein